MNHSQTEVKKTIACRHKKTGKSRLGFGLVKSTQIISSHTKRVFELRKFKAVSVDFLG